MAEKKLTPEDKLLNIIENPSLAEKKKIKVSPAKPAIKQRMKSWAGVLRDKSILLRLFKINIINNLLMGGCVLLSVFLAVDYNQQKVNRKQRLSAIIDKKYGSDSADEWPYFLKAKVSDDLQKIKGRNIFSVIKSDKNQHPKISRVEPDKGIEDLTLVAVFWSEINPQVMIEEKKTAKTTLLNTGDRAGMFIIKEIQVDSVVLKKDNDNQEWILK